MKKINLNFSFCDFDYYICLITGDLESTSFHVLVGHLHVFFAKMSISVFCPF